jgi:hypothetical protein
MGFVLSLGAGLGAVVLKDSLDPSIRGINDVRRLLSVPPLAAIPLIATKRDLARQRRVTRYSWQGGVLLIVGLAFAVHFLVRPLDVVWLGLLHRFGM